MQSATRVFGRLPPVIAPVLRRDAQFRRLFLGPFFFSPRVVPISTVTAAPIVVIPPAIAITIP
jgi:hypothetical protein